MLLIQRDLSTNLWIQPLKRLAHVYQDGGGIKSTRKNLEKLKNKEIDLGGKEEEVATMLSRTPLKL